MTAGVPRVRVPSRFLEPKLRMEAPFYRFDRWYYGGLALGPEFEALREDYFWGGGLIVGTYARVYAHAGWVPWRHEASHWRLGADVGYGTKIILAPLWGGMPLVWFPSFFVEHQWQRKGVYLRVLPRVGTEPDVLMANLGFVVNY